MIPVKHIDPDDLALYAMQLLSPEEAAEMHSDLQHSAPAREMLSQIYDDLSILAYGADMHAPPAEARQRLMKHVNLEQKAVPMDREPTESLATRRPIGLSESAPQRGVVSRVLPWVGWAVAAGMIFEAGSLYQQREQLKNTIVADQVELAQTNDTAELANTLMQTVKDPTAVQVTLTSSDVKPPPQGRASYVAAKGSLVFLASNLAPLQGLKTYELWLIPADGRNPIAAGTFRPDERGNASVILPKLPLGVAAKAFGVTIEDADGSQTPTMPILLKGAAS